ncbi:MAG: flagellar export chaperone FliS [Nitrospiraceae bacterium]|nr:MAG: flagellar export chaperone FliS [Nitrospiraceae bacterium]
MQATAMNQQTETQVPDRVQIITMLYDGTINFIQKAREKMEVGDSVGKSHFIKKTSAIVRELANSLNMDGGEIAVNLRNLYDFVLESLIKAEISNNMDALNDAEKVMEILRGSWREMQEASQA